MKRTRDEVAMSRGRAAGRGDPQDSPKRIPPDANVTDSIEQAEKIFQVFT
jgi:hypothetical protein